MTPPDTFVIVGAGLAGAKAAQTLREDGYDGRLVLLGDESERPYERPPLSKELLRGEVADDTTYVHEPDFYDDRAIELRTRTVVESLDAAAAEVVLADGERLRYDRLLLATGARPRRLTVPGAELDGIHVLRTLADCAALRGRLQPGTRLAVVGGGWIGSEVAASARAMGVEVTIIEATSVPLERVLGREIGAVYGELQANHGVRMLMQRRVAAFEGDGDGAVSAVVTADGERVACDLAVVGVGAVPRTELAERAGIAVANGIVCDEFLQTSAPGVYAAGDVAAAHHPHYDRAIRVEHWANALNQGPAAARNMRGAQIAYDRLPYFYSDQYDVGMEYTGNVRCWDEVVVRGDLAGREFIAFWLSDGRVLAGMNVNVWDVTDDIQALIRSDVSIDPASLRDPSVPLGELLGASAVGG